MLSLTDAGHAIAVHLSERLTGIRVQEKVQQLVSKPRWAIVEALVRAHPSDMEEWKLLIPTESCFQPATSPARRRIKF